MFSIDIKDFLKLSNVNIIDIRDVQKYNDSHIRDSINIPYSKLISNPGAYLDKDAKYYIYCQRGITSYNVCKILSKLGYDTVSVDGGYDAWLTKK